MNQSKQPQGTARYRCQRRGGKGLRDIKAGGRNGKAIGIVRVDQDDEILIMTSRGKLQRIAVNEIGIVGRNTKGVRIMKLDDGDSLSAVVRVPPEEDDPVDESATAPVTSEIVPDDELVDVPEADDARIDNEATDDVGDSNSDNDADSEDDSDSEIEN